MTVQKSKNLSQNQIRRLVITGMLAAIVVILVLTPLGMLQIGPIATTFAHIPVLIGLLAEGPVVGLVLALFFGAFSMFRAFQAPTLLSVFFQDPLVSILPRLMIPLVAWGAYLLLKKVLPESKSKMRIAWAGAGVVGSLTNTALVLSSLYFLHAQGMIEKFAQEVSANTSSALAQYLSAPGKFLFFAVALPNGLPEAVVTLILIPAIMAAVMAIKKRR